MASERNKEGMQLRSDFAKICDLLSDLAELDEDDLRFDDGLMVSETDSAMMRISYDDLARKTFWMPYAKDAKIEAALEDHEEMIDEIEHECERGTTQTTEDAYLLSMKYSDFVWFCVSNAAFQNPVFGGEVIDIFGNNGMFTDARADSVSQKGPCVFEQI